MDLYVPNEEIKKVSDVLTGENVNFKVTDEVFSLVTDEGKIGEVTKVEADLLETDVPVFYDRGPGINLRAFRLPSGKKVILADVNGNFMRVVEPPPGWER